MHIPCAWHINCSDGLMEPVKKIAGRVLSILNIKLLVSLIEAILISIRDLRYPNNSFFQNKNLGFTYLQHWQLLSHNDAEAEQLQLKLPQLLMTKLRRH